MIARFIMALVAVALSSVSLVATVPPRRDNIFPVAFFNRLVEQPNAFQFDNAFLPLVNQVRLNQRLSLIVPQGPAGAAPPRRVGPTSVGGTRAVPVLPVLFADSPPAALTPADLQKGIFDDPAAGVTAYFERASRKRLTLKPRVFGWLRVPAKERDYLGPQDCFGLCTQTRVHELVIDAVKQHANLNWSDYDNDGIDGMPNSGDDDGVVDFVILIHNDFGGECRKGAERIWTHHGSIKRATKATFPTSVPGRNGGYIQINDFVIAPARSCDPNQTIEEYGVYVHEIGHAFGLPDLYSTNRNYSSPGAGVWCLMGMGVYGGDGNSPGNPIDMSAWAKAFLGWAPISEVRSSPMTANLLPLAQGGTAFLAPIRGEEYYLIERRLRAGDDRGLPQSGLLVWRINDSIIESKLSANEVNFDPNALGLRLIEADGNDDLLKNRNWGDGGDPFRNPPQRNVSAPSLEGTLAICNVAGDGASADIGLGKCAAPTDLTTLSPPADAKETTPAAPSRGPLAVLGAAVGTIARHADRYVNIPVTFTARVINAGSNLFTDSNLRLLDLDGTAGLPAAIPGGSSALPPRKGVAELPGPPTLSSLLNIPLLVSGRLQRVEVKGKPAAYIFVVERARPASSP